MTLQAVQTSSPQLSVRRGRAAVDFYTAAFGAHEIHRVGETDDHEEAVERAVALGAARVVPVREQHGWLLGRIEDPFRHRREIGKPLGEWPPSE